MDKTVGATKIIWMQDGRRVNYPDGRMLNGMNLTKLAKQIGYERSYLSKVKHGHLKMTDTLEKKIKQFEEKEEVGG